MGKLDEIPMEDLKQRPGKGRIKKSDMIRAGKGGNKITPKQFKFAKGIAEGKSGTEAAMEAYDTDDRKTAGVIAAENLAKPSIQAALAPAFAAQGIDAERMAEILAEAMGAKKTGAVMGMVIESDVPDHSVRVSAVKTAAALLGVGKEPEDPNGKGNTFNFNFGQQSFTKQVNE